MNFTKKILLFCVVCYATLYCSADENDFDQIMEACTVQYLKQKGKLNESLQSTVAPTSQCRLLIPFFLQSSKSLAMVLYAKKFPQSVADCIVNELDNNGAFDNIIKSLLIETSSLFSRSEKIAQLNELNNQFYNVTEEAEVKCSADENRNEIFNRTLEANRIEYCKVSYVKQLLELINVDIDPHQTKSVNCEVIIDVERSKTEKEYSDRISATENSQSLDCVMNEFRTVNMSDWMLASTVAKDLSSHDGEQATNKTKKKLNKFLVASTSACNL